mmetsp:Transcript_20391/g.22651  ORF Transcript_20391/g.22651 Transcript_20391/m.22651 type:complete len:271 (+) Transcript_20391:33-845(+)
MSGTPKRKGLVIKKYTPEELNARRIAREEALKKKEEARRQKELEEKNKRDQAKEVKLQKLAANASKAEKERHEQEKKYLEDQRKRKEAADREKKKQEEERKKNAEQRKKLDQEGNLKNYEGDWLAEQRQEAAKKVKKSRYTTTVNVSGGPSKSGGSSKSNAPVRKGMTKSDAVAALMKSQQSDGSWKFDPKFGTMFNLDTTKMVASLPNPNIATEWGTAIVVMWIKLYAAILSETWGQAVHNAIAYLKAKGKESLLDDAKTAIRGMKIPK